VYKVFFDLGGEVGIVFVMVLDDVSVFEQGDAGADVEGVGEVVRGDDDGGSGLAVVALEQVLHGVLGRGVEEVEGFVEQEELGLVEHGSDDADLLLVACREVADEGFGADDFAVHKVVEALEALLELSCGDVVDLAEEVEIFLGGEIVDEEACIDVSSGGGFPLFAVGCGDASDASDTAVGTDEVEDDAEECGLSGSVITNESDDLSVVDDVGVNIECYFLAKSLADIFED